MGHLTSRTSCRDLCTPASSHSQILDILCHLYVAVRFLVLRHYGAVHVTLLPNRVISVFFSARFFTPKASEVPIPWVYTECFVESSTDDSPVPPARQPPASTLPWQTPPCSSPDLPIRSLPPAYTFHWASTQPAQHILCVRQPNQTHHLHRQRTKKKKEKKHTESGSWCSPQSVLQFHSHRQYT